MFGEYVTEAKHGGKEKYFAIKTLKTYKRLSEQHRKSGNSFSTDFGFCHPAPLQQT